MLFGGVLFFQGAQDVFVKAKLLLSGNLGELRLLFLGAESQHRVCSIAWHECIVCVFTLRVKNYFRFVFNAQEKCPGFGTGAEEEE